MTGTERNDELPGDDLSGSGEQPTPALDTVELRAGGGARGPRLVRLAVTAAAAVVVLAVGAVVFATSSGSPQTASQPSPAQVLAAAIHNSTTVRSLTVTYAEKFGGPAGVSVSGSVTEVRRPPQLSMTMTENIVGHAVPVSAIVSGTTIYLKLGGMSGLPSAIAGKWLEIPVSGLANGLLATILPSIQYENPLSQSHQLLAARQLRVEGTQVLGGVQTTRYAGYYVPSEALKLLPPSERALLAPALKLFTGYIYFTIWIDGRDLIRQLVEHETVSGQPLTITARYTSFNQPVTITVPPPSQVLQFPVGTTPGTA